MFYLGETLVAISLIPTRVPVMERPNILQEPIICGRKQLKTKTHKAHVLVAVLARDLTPVEAG